MTGTIVNWERVALDFDAPLLPYCPSLNQRVLTLMAFDRTFWGVSRPPSHYIREHHAAFPAEAMEVE